MHVLDSRREESDNRDLNELSDYSLGCIVFLTNTTVAENKDAIHYRNYNRAVSVAQNPTLNRCGDKGRIVGENPASCV